METIIGIDLGTTNSLCSVFQDGKPVLIPNPHGSMLTPSVVAILDDGRVVVGQAARELQVTRPEAAVACFKRWMGTDHKVSLQGKSFTPVELSSFVLKALKEDAEAFLKKPIEAAVITVPAYFNDHQRKATKQAGEMAGLKVRRIINEPTAAALTYGFHDRNAEKMILVVDLGGGTFDVTLMEIFEGTLEIVSTAGESMLGGEDFTDRIVATVLKKEGLALEVAEVRSPLRVSRLRQECELAKRGLATESTVRIRLPDDHGTYDESRAVKLDRAAFAKIVEPLMERIKRPITRAMQDGQREAKEIDEVILVGGATRMSVMQECVQQIFGKQGLIKYNPDEVVALGAAVQAALILDHADVREMVMTDVCPFTLGISIAKEFGTRIESGYFNPIIHRNTTIPVSREEVVCTLIDNQPEIIVKVYQGEARKVVDNVFLGELQVKDIPRQPAGAEIMIRFTYDLNGLLEVEAYVPSSNRKFSTVLTNHAATLSKFELEQAIRNLQRLKFYPRDDLENQRLLRYAERMVGEVNRFQREQLEYAVDRFLNAMVDSERESFASARQDLLITLEQLGISYDGQSEDEKP
ncbi:MAG: Hsp70 family protein [Planctomycetaceae bacterium]|nr:Hsp70 family protein [Planctomycetaceae bacterium]